MLQARLRLGRPWIGLRRISRSPLPHPSWPSLLVSDQLSLPSLNPRWRTPNRSRLAGPRHRGRWWGKLGKGGVGGYEQIHEYNYAIVLEIRKSENSNPWIVKKNSDPANSNPWIVWLCARQIWERSMWLPLPYWSWGQWACCNRWAHKLLVREEVEAKRCWDDAEHGYESKTPEISTTKKMSSRAKRHECSNAPSILPTNMLLLVRCWSVSTKGLPKRGA